LKAEAPLEKIRGVTIHRVAVALTGPHSLFRRGIAYLEYYRGARLAVRALIDAGDVVILKTDPPLLSAAVGHLAKRKGAKLVMWLQDIFPEVAHKYGMPGMGGPTGAALRRIRNQSLAIADRVVVIGDHMSRYVASTGVCAERIEVIHNWADGETIVPVERNANLLRRQWNLDSEFVVGYSGNLGRVHEFDTILDAAMRLKVEPAIRFVIIGRGPRLGELQARVAHQNLTNVRFEAHQDRSLLSQSLGAPDVHISILRPEFEGLVHPSKLYGIMAAGRPTIFIGKVTGETGNILAETDSGVTVPMLDGAALASTILRLRENPQERKRLGENARKAFEQRYDMPIALAKWDALLGRI
jgi:glycosyltransferase involved in cell wall biosynthesis